MNLLETITGLFLGQPTCTATLETFSIAEQTFEGQNLSIPAREQLLASIGQFPARDKIIVSISVDSDPFSFNSEKPELIDDFLEACRSHKAGAVENSVTIVKITISKSFSDDTISIYSIPVFAKTTREKKLREQLKLFEAVARPDKGVWIQLLDGTPPFKTGTLVFGKTKPESLPILLRTELRDHRNSFCSCDIASLAVTPDDFNLNVTSSNEDFDAILNNLCICVCIIYLADISETGMAGDGRTVNFRLNGYKTVTGTATMRARPDHTAREWFSIYHWVYSGGGISDKLGIARNIMSLHWKGTIADFVESGVLTSIRSGYEIYLKKNVEQYIAVKNKLNDYISDVLEKAQKLADGFADKFEKNVAAFASFFISSILAKVFTDSSFVGVFNRSVAIIGLVIIAGSILHLILSVCVFNKDKSYLESECDNLKGRYSDLLDKAELDKIFAKITETNQIGQHLKSKRNLFIGVWIALLTIALIVVLALTDWRQNPKPESSKVSIINPVQIQIQNTGSMTNK